MFEHANQFQVTMVQRSIINFSNTIDFFILFTVFSLLLNSFSFIISFIIPSLLFILLLSTP
ncbi:hypothetical protein yinte0001_5700 [Yersinia intermedia ATCC 29909]|nr:hypothetical protein yinte0001_5700 [Yersinia intermedia ATCC 29909]